MSATRNSADTFRLGLLFATGSAVSFGLSGPLAKSLMVAGWSPTAAVIARLAGGALVLVVVATIIKRDWLRQARAHARVVVVYGLVPVAGAQLCYYNAVAHLSVGVALLLEYTAPVLVVAWVWATTKQRPAGRTLAGVALAVVGVTLVLDVFSGGARIDAVGVVWALGAAICAVCYFMMSDEVSADGSGLHAITLAAGSLVVATVAIAVLGATALAYQLGISGVARLRPSFASLMGLAEVLAAVVMAWLFLGEHITAVQTVGGAVVLLGLALARPGGSTAEPAVSPVSDGAERSSASSLEQSVP